jgi:hypothetical protein
MEQRKGQNEPVNLSGVDYATSIRLKRGKNLTPEERAFYEANKELFTEGDNPTAYEEYELNKKS